MSKLVPKIPYLQSFMAKLVSIVEYFGSKTAEFRFKLIILESKLIELGSKFKLRVQID